MPRPGRARRTALAVALVLGALTASLLPTGLVEPALAASSPEANRARATLERVESLLSATAGGAGAPSGTKGPVRVREGRETSLAMRDLVLARPDLSSSDQRRAARVLSRPRTDSQVANDGVVVHYNAAQATPADAQATLGVVTQVRETYLAAGFRAPKADGVAGGDTRFDVYLADLAKNSAYGYCAPDDIPGRDKPAYCVIDSDFGGFAGSSTPTQLRQVTIAHEYFHAVQYGYDAAEDPWFMEGTAVWIEDQVYDDVNDNMQYAPFSPLARPRASLDVFEQSGFRQYGSWLFFRWLSEEFPEGQGGIPTIVRDFWEAADATRGNADKAYSLNAIAEVLKSRGLPLARAFALFADANRRPAASYSEGAANAYPTAPLAGRVGLARRGASQTRTQRLDHLAAATTRFVPQGGLTNRRTKLRIAVDMADKQRGSVAVVSTYRRDGVVKTRLMQLDARGNGTMKVRFSTRLVTGVEVTLANASKRYTDCYTFSTMYSCYGKPVDQDVAQRVRGTVVR